MWHRMKNPKRNGGSMHPHLKVASKLRAQRCYSNVSHDNSFNFNKAALHMLLIINLPTRIQVERACRRIKPFKARGPDGLPAGLYHHFPAMMASLMHPLMLKMSCLGIEPLGFKGGKLVHLYKGKGPADEPSNRRGILISNHASKVAHSSLRGQYTPFLEAAMLPMQVGGRPHK